MTVTNVRDSNSGQRHITGVCNGKCHCVGILTRNDCPYSRRSGLKAIFCERNARVLDDVAGGRDRRPRAGAYAGSRIDARRGVVDRRAGDINRGGRNGVGERTAERSASVVGRGIAAMINSRLTGSQSSIPSTAAGLNGVESDRA